MIHIDTTFEDIRLIARPVESPGIESNWLVVVHDNQTGEKKEVELTHVQLSNVLAINIDPDGTPPFVDEMMVELEELFKDWPRNLRPIA